MVRASKDRFTREDSYLVAYQAVSSAVMGLGVVGKIITRDERRLNALGWFPRLSRPLELDGLSKAPVEVERVDVEGLGPAISETHLEVD